jgi:hypothetical protein
VYASGDVGMRTPTTSPPASLTAAHAPQSAMTLRRRAA